MKRFEGKTALITGGGSGIGQAMAIRLAQEGATVVILELTTDVGEKTASMIRAANGKGSVLACDVSKTDSVISVFAGLQSLDVLINNAGIAHVGNVVQTTPDDLDRLYAVNVRGVYNCLHSAIPLMLKTGGGVILNLASIASKIGIQDRFAYSMTKGAVLSMTLSVARDYVTQGIRCNCICPARIHTPFVDGFLEKNYPDNKEEVFQRLSDYQPIGRMGTAEEVASLAAYLCSDEATFITGAAYDIDGGVISLR